MKNLETFEKQYLAKIKETKKIPEFNSGDTIIVYVKIKEKKRERDQAFEGVCIAKKNAGIASSFTVRKISYGEGVERVFPLYSPNVSKIKVPLLLFSSSSSINVKASCFLVSIFLIFFKFSLLIFFFLIVLGGV